MRLRGGQAHRYEYVALMGSTGRNRPRTLLRCTIIEQTAYEISSETYPLAVWNRGRLSGIPKTGGGGRIVPCLRGGEMAHFAVRHLPYVFLGVSSLDSGRVARCGPL